jgi:ferrous iron transport protein B
MKTIAVLGMPNTGKSTFFNRLTKANAHTGNWPGVTVELMGAKVKLDKDLVEVIDLPGIYDLRGYSEDEGVVRDVLGKMPLHGIVLLLNATQIDRQLSLAIQVQKLGLPTVVLLNMVDEALKFGVSIDVERLTAQLRLPVYPMSAKYGQGYETAVQAIADTISEFPALGDLDNTAISMEDLTREVEAVLAGTLNHSQPPRDLRTQKLDRVLLHPIWGLPIFFGTMYLVFQVVYAVGKVIQDGMTAVFEWFQGVALEPVLVHAPALLKGFLVDGLYAGMTTVAAFIPVIILFFLMMAIVEDSGYLSRSAYLMDAFMERLGLDGRSFVMSLMGFGCNVPAIMGTRVMRSPGLRMLSMLVIPFSLCSARLNVFVFMTTALFDPKVAPAVLFSLYLLSFVAAILTALIFKNKYKNHDPLILELPPYRFPTFQQIYLRAWCEVKHFIKRSYKFIILGVVAIWACNNLPPGVESASAQSISGMMGNIARPIFEPLGINPQLTVALVFGFIAKEIVLGGLAVIYGQSNDALAGAIASQIDWVQAYSFMLFTLLYVPCLSTIAVLRAESKSGKFAVMSVVWSLGLAWVASFVFYHGARLLGF